MVRTRVWVGWLCLSAFFTVGVGGCDKLGLGEDKKSSSKKSDKDDDEDDDDKKKKKKKSKDDDDDKAAAPMPVPNIAGFVVPAGGKHNHVDETFGSSRLVFESMDYPLKEFPRDKLRADFLAGAKGAGWACNPKGATDYDCSKDGAVVGVLFGEAGAEQTKINVFPPKGGGGAAGGTLFAGTYSSAWGSVIFTQKASDPARVTGRYPKGSILCTPQDQKLDCTWAESGASGRAVFTKTADGGMLGTWGSGGSSSSGGAWNLRLVTPGNIE